MVPETSAACGTGSCPACRDCAGDTCSNYREAECALHSPSTVYTNMGDLALCQFSCIKLGEEGYSYMKYDQREKVRHSSPFLHYTISPFHNFTIS